MADERDYGYINGFTPTRSPVDTIRYSQVYQATHDGGGIRLPLMNRSFISFLYGGRAIEDFNLLATIGNKRLERALYSDFKDNVTTYNNLDGRLYWGTHYTNFALDLTLSTDGIDERMLEEFKYWFLAGITRELILAEHPNRAINARVASTPNMSLLPFEGTAVLKMGAVSHNVTTTLYKGDINLTLESDSPHWYAISNILGRKVGDYYYDLWKAPDAPDVDASYVQIFLSQDAMKILYEDGIPLGSNIASNMLLGNGGYATINTNPEGRIWYPESNFDDIEWENGVPVRDSDENMNKGCARIVGVVTQELIDLLSQLSPPVIVKSAIGNYPNVGIISGAIVDGNGHGVDNVSANTPVYFFYSGTAPAYTIISFELAPRFISNYIAIPANKYVLATSGGESVPYNTIIVESRTQLTLLLTTPNIYTSYNRVVELIELYKLDVHKEWEDLFLVIRADVRHLALRAWVSAVLTYLKDKNSWSTPSGMDKNTVIKFILYFFLRSDNTADTYPVTFSFNSETGKATGLFTYRTLNKNSLPTTDAGWVSFGASSPTIVEEDVGDMLRSNYIIIRDRNYPSEVSGKIVGWDGTNEKTKLLSHRILHNFDVTINKLLILYKNMYL